MAYKIMVRQWRGRKIVMGLIVVELAAVVPLLIIFGLANPDTYRTLFWQIGYDNGWNSDPNMILYAYANHVPLPTIPFVWSQALTTLNVAISVTSLFVLLVKMIGFIMHLWYPLVGIFFSFALLALYATSVYGQAGPDYADPRYPSHVAWYIVKSCSVAGDDKGSCNMAKAAFALTCFMLSIYVANLGIAIWSMLPNKAMDEEEADDDDYFPAQKATDTTEAWEMPQFSPPPTAGGRIPATPRSPFTPRTQAFHTLDRKLPLRYT